MRRMALVFMLAGLAWLAIPAAARADSALRLKAPGAAGPVDCATFEPPVVAYDVSGGQSPSDVEAWIGHLTLDGFSVGTVSDTIPACVDILIVQNISGTLGLPVAYTAAEATAIKRWVDAGHALMVLSDWGAYKAGTEAIFAAFDYELGGPEALVDRNDAEAFGGSDWVIFQSDNFSPHPILKGVESVVFPRGAWLSPPAAAIITSDADSKPPGVPVMAAITSGAGCVVLASDSNWPTNVTSTRKTEAGYFKRDNALLARQAVSWLNGCGHGPTAWPGGPYSVTVGDSLLLDGAASSDPEGKPLTFAWDLDGDRQFTEGSAVTATFSAAVLEAGAYTVSLRVSNSIYTDTGWTRVTVLKPAPAPTSTPPRATAEPGSGATGQPSASLVSLALAGVIVIVLAGLVVARRAMARTRE